ncbi:hypothetical protein IJG72_07895 [bacterium]|nr:hypothetical protein [bacterium]
MKNKKFKATVFGIGGGGQNIINYIYSNSDNLKKINFVSINTDEQMLLKSKTKKFLLDDKTTKSNLKNFFIKVFGKFLIKKVPLALGSGGDITNAILRTKRYKDIIEKEIKKSDIIFLVACLGGGTGTGTSTVIAEYAKKLNKKVFCIVTKPFIFEGERRMAVAISGINQLEKYADKVFTIENEKLLENKNTDINTPLSKAFNEMNQEIKNIVLNIFQDFSQKES